MRGTRPPWHGRGRVRRGTHGSRSSWPVRVDPAGVGRPDVRAGTGSARGVAPAVGCTCRLGVDGSVLEQRIVEAAAVLPGARRRHRVGALRWSGGVWFDGLEPDGQTWRPVTLATGYSDIGSSRASSISQERLGPRELVVVDGVRTTRSFGRCASRCGTPGRARGGRALDMAAYYDLVSIGEVAVYASAHPGVDRHPASAGSRCPDRREQLVPAGVRHAHVWVLDAGLPRPLCNHPVFDGSAATLGTPDLLDAEAGLVVEYDGRPPRARPAQRDRDREEAFRRLGLEYLTIAARVTPRTATHWLHGCVEARSRARWRADGHRRGPSSRRVVDPDVHRRAAAQPRRHAACAPAAATAGLRDAADRTVVRDDLAWSGQRLDDRNRHGLSERQRLRDDLEEEVADPVAGAAARPAIGKVRTQAMRIERATPQRTAERRLVAPTPMTAEVMVWVVEIGASIDVRRRVEHDGGDRLGGEAAGGVEVDDPAAEGAHDPPAAGVGAERDRGRGREDHPEREVVAGAGRSRR